MQPYYNSRLLADKEKWFSKSVKTLAIILKRVRENKTIKKPNNLFKFKSFKSQKSKCKKSCPMSRMFEIGLGETDE